MKLRHHKSQPLFGGEICIIMLEIEKTSRMSMTSCQLFIMKDKIII